MFQKTHVAALLLFLTGFCANETLAQGCPEWAQESSGTHRFRYIGESLEIPLVVTKSTRADADETQIRDLNRVCQPVALNLFWSNGRNNGSNLRVTILDLRNRPLYAKQFSAFTSGTRQISLTALAYQGHFLAVPSRVVVQTVAPFALPAHVSYMVMRVSKPGSAESRPAEKENLTFDPEEQGPNDKGKVVVIRTAHRIIGATRVELVQVELRTNQPLPSTEQPMRLRIGKQVFVDEVWGDHTGRKLVLSLTPKMFTELEDGGEIVALFDQSETESWSLGKLDKSLLEK